MVEAWAEKIKWSHFLCVGVMQRRRLMVEVMVVMVWGLRLSQQSHVMAKDKVLVTHHDPVKVNMTSILSRADSILIKFCVLNM